MAGKQRRLRRAVDDDDDDDNNNNNNNDNNDAMEWTMAASPRRTQQRVAAVTAKRTISASSGARDDDVDDDNDDDDEYQMDLDERTSSTTSVRDRRRSSSRRSRRRSSNSSSGSDDVDDGDGSTSTSTSTSDSDEEEEEEITMTPQARRRRQSTPRQPRARTATPHQHPELLTLWEELDSSHPLIPTSRVEQPPELKMELLPFQKEGLSWLIKQEETKFHGGILADEMGMGKTIQMIALLLSVKSPGQPTLIVCPTIALMQWKAEIETHTTPGAFNVELYYGATRDRSLSRFQAPTIFLTTYSTIETEHRKQEYGFKRNGETIREKSPLFQVSFFRVILDEAHSIKDRSSNTARAVFQLKCERKWSLSGTPLQNRVGELYSLIRFLQVSPFSYYFCSRCDCKMIQWSFKKDHKHCDDCGHISHQHYCWWNREILRPIQKYGALGEGREAFQKLSRLMPRIMLRRTKLERADDLGLPPRVVVTRRDYFNEEEEDFYDALYSESKTKFVSYVQQGTLLNNYAHVFELITRMRQAADHPFLITHRIAIDGDRNIDVCGICQEIPEDPIQAGCKHIFCREDIARYLASSISEESVDCPICFKKLSIDLNQPTWEAANKTKKRQSIISRIDIDRWRSSTKIEALLEELTMLREQGDNIKSIVFSQYVNFLDLIEWRLQKAGFRCVKLDGTMSSMQRDAIIHAFMTMPQITVFLISLKAGGIALNLTEASRVFLLDPWWNPAVEAQAMDRIHRLGQFRPIQVTRIVIENSIESRIIQLQEKKNLLFQSTVGMDVDALSRLTEDDLQFLFVL